MLCSEQANIIYMSESCLQTQVFTTWWEVWKKKKAITDEEGDVLLTRFDLAFCSIDCMDPDGVKKNKVKGKCTYIEL